MTEQTTTQEITITEKAANQVRKIMKENNVEAGSGLRVGVKGGGCSGLTYQLGFDGKQKDGDTIIEQHGIKLFVDGKSLFYLMVKDLLLTILMQQKLAAVVNRSVFSVTN
jgi:iron-sulfur cluster assembly protein